ncbi:hypothetical protein, partial [Streptomyces sp. N35]|uniref:hypothetical protein n=1 Tax=Streptomyces sp. N35 TaxID=2795730 RepID=UPI0018F433BD
MSAQDTTSTAPATPKVSWPLEGALVSAALAAQRIQWIDAPARALGLTPFTRRQLTRQALAQVRRTSGGRPARVHTAFGSFLMPFDADDARSLIAAAVDAHAQGTVSAFTDDGTRIHLAPHTPLAVPVAALRAHVLEVAADTAGALLAARQADSSLLPQDWESHVRRAARRIVLGDEAAPDALISDILDATVHAADEEEHEARKAALHRRLPLYAAYAPVGETAVEHALQVVTQALTETAAQALALMAGQPRQPAADPVEQAVSEALRHYPPLSATRHRVLSPFTWHGMTIDAGTEILCATTWLRDLDDTHGHLHLDPSTALCAAPAPCDAAGLAILAAGALLRGLTRDAEPAVHAPRLTPGAPPASLPARSLRLALVDRAGPDRAGA